MPQPFLVNRVIWLAIFMVAAVDGFWLHRLGWQVEVTALSDFLAIMGACLLVSLVSRYLRLDERLFFFGNAINQMICIGFALGFLSYLSATLGRPLYDDVFFSADRQLGFDWLGYLRWVDGHAWLAQFFNFAYMSFGFQIIFCVCVLFASRRVGQAQRFIMAFFCTSLACILLSAFFPALGMFNYYRLGSDAVFNINAGGASSHAETLAALRSHVITGIHFPLQGVIMFPSFHAAVALLVMYATFPLCRLRLVMIPLNIAMLISTPVNGGHYLVDALAGIAVAFLAIALARKILFPRFV